MITLHTIIYKKTYLHIDWFKDFKHPLITNKLLTVTNIDEGFSSESIGITCMNSRFDHPYRDPYVSMIDSVKTEFVLHVAVDCMGSISINDDFFDDSLSELQNESCYATLVNWGADLLPEEKQAFSFTGIDRANDKFYRRLNFTDQFFLAKTSKLKTIDLEVDSNISRRIYAGPPYGRGSFEEAMVGNQILSSGYNSIHKGSSFYAHRSSNFAL